MSASDTLDEAIETVLLGWSGRSATTTEISEEIARRGLWTRRDGKFAKANQVNARVSHSDLLEFVSPGVVRLKAR